MFVKPRWQTLLEIAGLIACRLRAAVLFDPLLRKIKNDPKHGLGAIFYAAEVGLYEQISRLNNHRPFRLPPMRAATLNFFGTLSVRYELLAPM